jgi:hypothetical protein
MITSAGPSEAKKIRDMVKQTQIEKGERIYETDGISPQ